MALLASVFNHLVLPPKIPGQQDEDLESITQNVLARLIHATNTLDNLSGQSQDQASVWLVTRRSLRSCQSLHRLGSLEKSSLKTEFQRLHSNWPLFLHVAEQNAALIIRRDVSITGADIVVFEAFETSPPSAEVLASQRALLWDFPDCAAQIPFSEFEKLPFQEALSDFLEQGSVEPLRRYQAHVTKAQTSVVEARDTPSPALVTHLLIPLLEAIGSTVERDTLHLSKRVRDDVNIVAAELPWRRLPFWLVLRVCVQRQLQKSLGNEIGRAHYKFLIAIMLAELLEECPGQLAPELTFILRGKLCRRLAKLEQEKSSSPEVYKYLFDMTRIRLTESITNATKSVESAWDAFKGATMRQIPLLPTRADQQSQYLTLPNSGAYLQSLLNLPRKQKKAHQSLNLPPLNDSTIAQVEQFTDSYFRLADMEKRIESDQVPQFETSTTPEVLCRQSAEAIFNLFETTGQAYNSDPAQMSIFILTLFTLWVRMDSYAVRACPLFQEYRPMFSPELLDVLHLSSLSEMQRLHNIQKYMKNRCEKCKYRKSILAEPDKYSFPVKYVAQSTEMLQLLEQVKEESDRSREAKKVELEKWCEKYDDHSEGFSGGTCVCKFNPNGSRDVRGCTKCWHRRARNRMEIYAHEDFLPQDPAKAAAIIFELRVPRYISAYRNATWKIFQLAYPTTPTSLAPVKLLKDYEPFKNYGQTFSVGLTIASTRKSFLGTHYKVAKKRMKASKHDVLYPNDLNFFFFDVVSKTWIKDFDKPMTFQHLCGVYVPPGIRASVMPQLIHPPTEVSGSSSYEIVASETRCPSDMSVHEFMAYQRLLSGNTLRWPMMLVELGASDVNFSNESTMHMLNHLATQAGSTRYEPGPLRDSHAIFEDASFCNRLATKVAERLRSIASNWREVHCMEILITLALRLATLALSKTSALALLKEARNSTLQWVTRLRSDVRSATESSTAKTAADYAFYAALLCRRTFSTFMGEDQILSEDDLSTFVQASLALQENLLVDLTKLSPTLKSMLIRDTKMAYRIQSQILQSIRTSPRSIGMAINKSWSSNTKVFGAWQSVVSQTDRWVVTTMTTPTQSSTYPQVVHYNFIEGHLLIDGKPLGRLPRDIRESEEVKKLFEGEHLLTFPSAEPGMSHVMATRKGDQEIHFGIRNGRVIVRASSRNGLLEYIPEDIFAGSDGVDIPWGLVQGCVHWLNLDSHRIEVRRKNSKWRLKRSDWIIDITNRRAIRNGRVLLVDPNSNLAKQVTSVFRGFEDPRKITIFQPIQQLTKLAVEIRHLELSFFVNKRGLLECRQLREEIDPNQDAGALYGFDSKIVLRDTMDNTRRSIIAPWGEISVSRRGMHVSVRAASGTEYARFGIDDVLGRLSCPPEPRLMYAKAQFHAFTSFVIPDALTGRTGTEEALDILQSGYCQPWMSLGENPVIVLKSIQSLSPVREYYPKDKKTLQSVCWNSDLTTTIQQDAFESLVQSILIKSEQLRVFSGTNQEDIQTAIQPPTHLRQRGLAQRCLYQRLDGGMYHKSNIDRIYVSRGQQAGLLEATNVFQIIKSLRIRPFSIDITRKLSDILQEWPMIGGFHNKPKITSASLSDSVERNVDELWGDIVDLCRTSSSQEVYSLMFRLSLMSLNSKTDLNVIKTLAAFASLPELKALQLPYCPSFNQFRMNEVPRVESLLRIISVDLPPRPTGRFDEAQETHRKACEAEAKGLANHFQGQWPNRDITLNGFNCDHIDDSMALERVIPEWNRLHQNLKLSEYVTQVERILAFHSRPVHADKPNAWSSALQPPASPDRGHIVPYCLQELLIKDIAPTLKSLICNEKTFGTEVFSVPESHPNRKSLSQGIPELRKILSCFTSSSSSIRKHYGRDLEASLDALERNRSHVVPQYAAPNTVVIARKIHELRAMQTTRFNQIRTAISANFDHFQWLELGKLWPCNSPIELLEQLRSSSNHRLGRNIKQAIVSYGVLITQLQRLLRIQNTLYDGKLTRLQEELGNTGYENWDPLEYPDWLLLEIDSDIMIRNEQIDVARAIVAPESRENTVLQLNMGKGKTSCIVPMAMAVLGTGEQLARLVVPKPLLLPTAQMIQSRLGGLVGRTIRHIPFSRRTKLSADVLQLYQTLHEDMLNCRGVILNAPEHVLSYKLSGLQQLTENNLTIARKMINFQSWLNSICRDVLDESDVSLAVKTQLIYPSGQLSTVDGHPHRWQVVQSLLSLVKDHLPELQRLYPRGIEVIERKNGFPMIHILQSEVEEDLHRRIITEVCAGRTSFLRFTDATSINRSKEIRKILLELQLDNKTLKRVAALFVNREVASKILLLLRGLLRNRILLLCLKKRWNVQYGLHPTRDPIAVPFEAKGIPSEQAEFGHPDAAIIFTCLAFYYTGVNQSQFSDALRHVLSSPDPSSEYDRWTSSCDTLPEALCHWNVINIDDRGQVEALWDHLRTSRSVLDHYMNHFVFPAHAKQFDTKLQASGWDLPLFSQVQSGANVDSVAKTTGFSGTNDNKAMLPLTIKQHDLHSLQHTNAEVLTYLLKDENREYNLAARGGKRLSEFDFLRQLASKKIRILIDAGAFILEMSNEALVTAWMEVDSKPQAAVFFDNDNRAWVKYRHRTKASVPLLATPLADNLDKCLVYLDEAHTRGVDLKLPQDARGALTLALGQTKDHTVQAAMRLRQLATTQKITFFAFPETNQSIIDVCKLKPTDRINSSHIVRWLLEQTCRANEQVQNLYISQGTDFCNRTSAEWENRSFLSNVSDRNEYVKVIKHPEQQLLEHLYGDQTDKSCRPLSPQTAFAQIQKFIDVLRNLRLNAVAGSNTFYSSALEEVEQEREVEFQVEEVREIQRPVHYEAHKFKGLHHAIYKFACDGYLSGDEGYEHLSTAVSRTAIGKKFNAMNKESRLFVSAEFMKTIEERKYGTIDNFMRPVEWVLYCPTTSTALILIAEEAELLIFFLRNQKPALVHLLTYSAPVTKKMLSFSALTYYSLPLLPKTHTIPSWLVIELGTFAGRLYMSFDEYCLLAKHVNSGSSEIGFEVTAAKTTKFLLEWLALRRKGQDIMHTPIGYLCQCRPIDAGHAFFSAKYVDGKAPTLARSEGFMDGAVESTDEEGDEEDERDNVSEGSVM